MLRLWHEIWSLAFLIGVIGNLVAALLWAVPAIRRIHIKLDRQHKERLDQQDRQHSEHLEIITKQHQELRDAILRRVP